ncbi:MAG: class I SAM-dependent methyltransferase [Methanobacteriaceae archaeon]|jgi:ubiquinone/menaquinone biosynthesis C-methylase UbiE|nr:class I SAM-dependent methyltransferase [Candidatus Methanorudis spinitermitis]
MGLMKYFIEQSIKPEGVIGRIMLKIMNNTHKSLFQLGLSNINLDENCKLLDLACGGGNFLKIASKKHKNIKLFGIDFSKEAIRIASKNNKKDIHNGKIRLLQGDIGKIPFTDNYFHVITAFQTHFHWEDLSDKIKEIYRVLNENGQFIIVAEKYKVNYHMEKYKTENDIKELFDKAGFENIEYKETKDNMFITGVKIIPVSRE